MKIVTKDDGLNAPGLCVFTADTGGPFLDTGRWLPYADPYGYIHVPFAKEIGRAVGMVEAEEHEALKAEIAEKQVLLEEFAHNLSDLQEQVEAFKTVKEMVAA